MLIFVGCVSVGAGQRRRRRRRRRGSQERRLEVQEHPRGRADVGVDVAAREFYVAAGRLRDVLAVGGAASTETRPQQQRTLLSHSVVANMNSQAHNSPHHVTATCTQNCHQIRSTTFFPLCRLILSLDY